MKYFNEESIREHIIISIHECRCAVNKRYDYEMVANCLTYNNSVNIHISYIINQNVWPLFVYLHMYMYVA